MIYSEDLINAVVQLSKQGSADLEYLRYLNAKRENERKEQKEKDRGLFSRLFNKIKVNPFMKKIGKIAIFIGKYILQGILFALGIDIVKSLFDLGSPGGGFDIIYF